MKWLAPFITFLLTACSLGRFDWTSMSRSERQQSLSAISAKCSLPLDRFVMAKANALYFRPLPDDRYESLDCALAELKNFKGIELGFVGNEAYVGSEK